MQLLPAIDLRGGRVVRLRQGLDGERTVYDVAPRAALESYARAGVERVHLIDLDAALGEAPQRRLIEDLVTARGAPRIELGGGLRDGDAVEWALGIGCERVVVTSLLVRDFELFLQLVESFPRRLVPALDLLHGELRIAGWREGAPGALDELCAALLPLPLPAVLVTDIERDGTMEGPNLELACGVSRRCGAPALLSGGVRNLADLEAARQAPEIAGAIVGRALYDGAIDLHQALAVCAGTSVGEVP